MSGSVNKVILIGNVGANPEFRTFSSGDRVASFSIATSEKWKDKGSGEWKERTQWHRIVVNTTGLANIVERYIKKGTKVYIEGMLENRKYSDKNGNDAYTTEVVLKSFRSTLLILDKKESSDIVDDTAGYSAPEDCIDDDEIPF